MKPRRWRVRHSSAWGWMVFRHHPGDGVTTAGYTFVGHTNTWAEAIAYIDQQHQETP